MILEPPKPPASDKKEDQNDQNLSMRDRQKQVGSRVNQEGQKIDQPRLAQERRPRPQDQSNNMPGVGTAKNKAKKWMAGLIGGSIGAGALGAWWIT